MSFCWPESIRLCLLPLADPTRAAGMKTYMRGQFDFFGIPTPVRRKAVAALLRQQQTSTELLDNAYSLWAMPERECQYVAIDLLARHWKTLASSNLTDLLALVQEKSWWDSVDGLAAVVSDIVHAARMSDPDAQQVMDAVLLHPNLWVRRVAILHQLGWRADTDRQRLFDYAQTLANEPDFFIRKAIGWALRDFARHDSTAVAEFLAGTGLKLSPLSRREAGKHLAC